MEPDAAGAPASPAASRQASRLAAAAGVALVLIGSLVLVGWATGVRTLVQLHSDLAPMQGNAAVGLVLERGREAALDERGDDPAGRRRLRPRPRRLRGHVHILESRVRHEYGEGLRKTVDNQAGDFLFIEPGVPHEVVNLSDTEPVVAVVARSDASEWENIVAYER